MKKVKEKLNLFIKSWKIPLFLFLIYICIIILKTAKFEDDLWFSTILQNENWNIFQFVQQRYYTWSSRVIIEAFLVTFENININIWRVATVILFGLLAYSITYLLSNKKNRNITAWITCFLIGLIPMTCINHTGWLATTLNYLYPITFGLVSLIILKKIFLQEKIKKVFYIISTMFLIFAINQEQMVVMLFLIYGFANILYLLKFKKVNKFLVFSQVLIILSLIFILTCPGNDVRMDKEIDIWYPEFREFSVFDKGQLGITVMMRELFLNGNILFLIFTGVLMMAILKKKNVKIVNKIISSIPFLSSLVLSDLWPNSFNIISNYKEIFNANKLIIDGINLNNIGLIIFFAFYLIILAIIMYSIFILYKNKKEKMIIYNGIFCLGIISKLILGFSPTVFPSALRSSFIIFIAIIVLTIIIVKENFLLEVEDEGI